MENENSDKSTTYAQPMMRQDALKGKTIVITGGGTGLGRSMGTYFLKLGANLVITSRKLDVLEATAKEMEEETGGTVLALACDVRDYDQIEAMLKAAVEKFGTVDGLLNNAAGNFISPTERLSHRAYDTIVDIVLKGTYYCTLAFGKYWIEEGKKDNYANPKTVLSIVTTYAETGSGYVVPSATSKAGVVALTKSLAVEWTKYGIRFNGIAPGAFPTKGAWERLMPKNLQDKFDIKNRVPVKRVGDHQELANLAAYLISDYSAYINGQIITIDGGEVAQGSGQFSMLEHVPQEMWDMVEQMTRSAKSS